MPPEDPVLTNLRCPSCGVSLTPSRSQLVPDHGLLSLRCYNCNTLVWLREEFNKDTGREEIKLASAAQEQSNETDRVVSSKQLPPDPSNPPNPKQRYGDLKPPLALIPPSALIHESRAFAEGARKYGPYNWRLTKVEAMTYAHAIIRHTMAYVDGEDTDPETPSGVPHLALVRACAAILLDATECRALIDNRPPPGRAAALIRELTQSPSSASENKA